MGIGIKMYEEAFDLNQIRQPQVNTAPDKEEYLPLLQLLR